MKQILRWAGIVVIGVAGACWLCAGVMAQEATVRNVERTWVEPTKTDDDGSGARQAQIKLAAAQTRYEYLLVRKESIDPEVMGAFEALKLAKEELRQYTGYWIETVPDDGNKNQWKEDDRDGTDDGDVGTPLGTETFSYLVDAQKKPLVSTAPVYGSETFNLTVDPSTGTRRINLVIRGHVVDPEGLGVADARVLVTVENTPKVITSRADGSYEASFTVDGYANRVIQAGNLVLRAPCLLVDPPVIHFGPVVPTKSLERQIEVVNTCDYFLEIEWDKLVAGAFDAFVLDWKDWHSGAPDGPGYIHGKGTRDAKVGPNVRLPMIVTFTPPVPMNYSGEVLVSEKEPPGPAQQVTFYGSADGITVSPNQVEFGFVKETALASSTLKITNISPGPVALELRLEGMREDFTILSVDNQPHLVGSPVNIQSGKSIDVILMCSPKPGPEPFRSAVLVIDSGTAAVPQTRVELSVMADR